MNGEEASTERIARQPVRRLEGLTDHVVHDVGAYGSRYREQPARAVGRMHLNISPGPRSDGGAEGAEHKKRRVEPQASVIDLTAEESAGGAGADEGAGGAGGAGVTAQEIRNLDSATAQSGDGDDDDDDIVITGEVRVKPTDSAPPKQRTRQDYRAEIEQKYTENDEVRRYVPQNLRSRYLGMRYGKIVKVTENLIAKATAVSEEVARTIDWALLAKIKLMHGTSVHRIAGSLEEFDQLVRKSQEMNRSLLKDVGSLRHNKHSLEREWNYKLEVRNVLIEKGKVPYNFRRPPVMDMVKVNLAVFRAVYKSMREACERLRGFRFDGVALEDVIGVNMEGEGGGNNTAIDMTAAQSTTTVNSASKDGSEEEEEDDEEPEILSVSNIVSRANEFSPYGGVSRNEALGASRNGGFMTVVERRNQMRQDSNQFRQLDGSQVGQLDVQFRQQDSQFRPQNTAFAAQQAKASQWWEDEFFKSEADDALTMDGGGMMANSNVYRQNEAESLRGLLNGIRPDEEYAEGMEKTPADMLVPLLKHQRIGLAWMKAREASQTKGGILADDMGLGKTVQALAIMMRNRSQDQKCKTNLVVTPVSLLRQWEQEASTKLRPQAGFSCFIYHQTNRAKTFAELQQYDMVLVSYNTLASEWKKHYALALGELRRRKSAALPALDAGGESYRSPFFGAGAKFYRIVLDEAQNIKNKRTNASRSVATLEAVYRWCLSGTPIQNRIDELYPQLRFLRVAPYCDERRFQTEIAAPVKSGWDSTRAYGKLHAVLSAVLLRRTKDSEIDGQPILRLPAKHTIVDEVAMTDTEQAFYRELEQNSAKQAKRLMEQQRAGRNGAGGGRVSAGGVRNGAGAEVAAVSRGGSAYSSILTLLLRLRQACDHYYLVKIGNERERGVKRDNARSEYDVCRAFSAQAVARIDRERARGLECQLCGDDVPDEDGLLLSGCGHVVCRDCKTPFFDEYADGGWEGGDRRAKCRICGAVCEECRCAGLDMYDAAVGAAQTWAQTKRRLGLGGGAQDRDYKAAKLKELIAADGGRVMVSAKVSRCVKLVSEILKTRPGEKIIIFSQFTTFFDILQVVLYANRVSYLRYDGTMDVDTKNSVVSCFYNDASKRVMLLSLKAGNVGLTLTCANHVILLEPFWNPYVEKQAQDRVHRISQTREVFVHRILVKGTVEDRIMELQQKKERMVETALDPKARKSVNKLSRTELGFLFGLNGLAGL